MTAEIKLDEEPVKFDLLKIDETRYELRLIPVRCGIYQIHMHLNLIPIKGSPFLIKIDPASSATANDCSSNTNTQMTNISSLTPTSHMTTTPTPTSSSSPCPCDNDPPSTSSRQRLSSQQQQQQQQTTKPLSQQQQQPLLPPQPPQSQQHGNSQVRKKSAENIATAARRQLRTELFDLTNQSDDLVVGEEVKLNGSNLFYREKEKTKNFGF